MTRARSLLLPALLVGLVALAVFGVRQVIVGQEGPQFPLPDEERQRLEEAADAAAREAIRQFADSGGDACSLPTSEFSGHPIAPYSALPAFINDVDLIVSAQTMGSVVEPPEPHTVAGRVLATVQVDEVLSGNPPGPTISVDYKTRVMQGAASLQHVTFFGLDPCASEQVLLFLNRTADPSVFSIGSQGWARIEADTLDAEPINELFLGYTSAQDLLAAVQQIAQEQQAQGLLKGLLLCESKRTSNAYLNPIVCPGDTFNPYQTFQLSNVRQAYVATTDPGPSPLGLFRTDLDPGGGQLNALLVTLDVEVTMEPAGLTPEDLISLHVLTAAPDNDRMRFDVDYSPSTGILQLTSGGGQFAAPPAFQQAMAPFLAPQ